MQPCNEQIKRLTKQQKFQRLELANSHVHVVEDVDLSNLEQQHFRLRECLAQSLRFNKTLQISPGSFQLHSIIDASLTPGLHPLHTTGKVVSDHVAKGGYPLSDVIGTIFYLHHTGFLAAVQFELTEYNLTAADEGDLLLELGAFAVVTTVIYMGTDRKGSGIVSGRASQQLWTCA
jgi:hypothetical protein